LKIVVTESFDMSKDEIARIKALGDVVHYDKQAKTADEWLERVKGAEIICTGKFGLKEKIYELSNVFISVPFVAVNWIDKEKIRSRKITVANSPGCNKDAVSEWIIGMLLNLSRELPTFINTKEKQDPDARQKGLRGKKITILGKGNIGSKVGVICNAMDMDVSYFMRGDNLKDKVKNADYIVDCLGANESTNKILNKNFFQSIKKGAYFLTVTGSSLIDVDAMLTALDNGTLAGVATDCGEVLVGNVNDPLYKRLSSHPKIMATPHIAFRTDVTARIGNDMMISNVEKFLEGNPINVVK
jgi:phosphoglycerate dehydrogenase-like enzyme